MTTARWPNKSLSDQRVNFVAHLTAPRPHALY